MKRLAPRALTLAFALLLSACAVSNVDPCSNQNQDRDGGIGGTGECKNEVTGTVPTDHSPPQTSDVTQKTIWEIT